MKLFRNRSNRAARRGLTALEITVSSAILLLTAKITVTAIDRLQHVSVHTSSSTKLQEAGQRAMTRVIALLQRSGVATVGPKSYPYMFVDGQPAVGFDNHAHAAPIGFVDHHGVASAPNREIVFVQPVDNDAAGQPGHGVPDVDGQGALMWDPVEHSLVVVPVGDDVNELQYRLDGDSPTTLAVGVESFQCFDNSSSGVTLPAEAIQIELTLRGKDDQGQIVRYTTTAVVRLRNG